jgi:hypothetical protein
MSEARILFESKVLPMHHFIQKLRTALKDENTVYAQHYRFLGLLLMLYFAFAGEAETGTT